MTFPTERSEVTHRDWATANTDGVIRFAVIGIGGFAKRSALPAIEEAEHCKATVLVTGSPDDRQKIAQAHEIEAVIDYESYHESEQSEAYDAVYVATPNGIHLPMVETAARLNKAVICEKPLEKNFERARKLVTVCEQAGVPLMTAYRMHLEPATRRMRECIQQGVIGDPVFVDGIFSFRIGDMDRWRLDPEIAGGAALYDIGVYPINTARFLLDEDPTQITGRVYNQHPEFEGIDEHISVQLHFESGATADCRASFNAASHSDITVRGTKGVLSLEPAFGVAPTRSLRIEADSMTTTIDGIDVNEVTEEFEYFAQSVLDGRPIEPDGQEGLVDMAIITAAEQTSQRGETIALESILRE